MNWIILYIFCFSAILINLIVGYFVNKQSDLYFENFSDFKSENGIVSKELSNIFINKYKLRNLTITSLRSKNSNYYSAKYNVIKLSPDTIYSSNLKNLAITSKCLGQAKKQQTNYISSSLQLFCSTFLKFFTIAFLPTIFISAILNISFGLAKLSFIATLVSLIGFIVSLIIHLIFYFINKPTINQTTLDLNDLNIFTEDELNAIHSIMVCLLKRDFFKFSRLSLKFISYLNPASLFESRNN